MAEWEQNSALRDLVQRTREFQQPPTPTPPPEGTPPAAGPQTPPAAPTGAPAGMPAAPMPPPPASGGAATWETNPTIAALARRTQRAVAQGASSKVPIEGQAPAGGEFSGLSRFRPVPPPTEKPMSWRDVGSQAAGNFVESLKRESGALYEAVTSPVETAKGLLSLAQGAISKGAGALGFKQDATEKLQDERVLNALVQHYKNAYGSEEAAKRYIAENPVAVLSDASLVLSGGIGALSKAGKVAGLGATAETLGKAAGKATLLDPINLGLRGTGALAGKTGDVIRGVSSKFTGVPKPFMDFLGTTFRSNSDAARTHADTFNRYLGGAGDYRQIDTRSTRLLDDMRRERAQNYQDEIRRINPNARGINLTNLSQSLGNKFNQLERVARQYRTTLPNGRIVSSNPVAEARVQNLEKLLNSVNTHALSPDPAMRSLAEIDNLKHNLDDWVNSQDLTKSAKGDVIEARKAVRDALGDPSMGGSADYAALMDGYSEVSNIIKTISDQMQFGRGADGAATVRASMRKFKDPTYRPIFDEIARRDPELIAMLAGAVMSPYTRSGAVTLSELAAALPFWTIGSGPGAVTGATAAMAAGSPRLAGRVIQRGQQVSDVLGAATSFPATQAARTGQMASEAEREGLTAEQLREQVAPIDPAQMRNVKAWDERATPYDGLITQSAIENGVDPVLLKRLIGSESNFDPSAYARNEQGEINVDSQGRPTGVGIMQINSIHGLPLEKMLDPNFAIPWGTAKLREYLDASSGDYQQAILRYKGASSEEGISRMMPITRAIVATPQERIERASGGRVGGDVGRMADELMLRAKAARKQTTISTKPLLTVPDETVAKALAVANSAL